MSESNKATLLAANAAITQGDYNGFLEFCTDNTQWTFVGDRVLNGKDEVRRWMTVAYVKPPKFEVRELIADGDFVVALGEIAIETQKGRSANHSYCDVWRFRDGKMAELKAFVVEAK